MIVLCFGVFCCGFGSLALIKYCRWCGRDDAVSEWEIGKEPLHTAIAETSSECNNRSSGTSI